MTWLFDWSACLLWGLLGHGWRTPRGWIAHEAERVRQDTEWAGIKEKVLGRLTLAPVPPVVYHGDTPAKEARMRFESQPDGSMKAMDDLPNPTSVIYLFIVLATEDDDYQVLRVSSDTPHVPCVGNGEEILVDDDYGVYAKVERALAVAKKLNDEERARRFA